MKTFALIACAACAVANLAGALPNSAARRLLDVSFDDVLDAMAVAEQPGSGPLRNRALKAPRTEFHHAAGHPGISKPDQGTDGSLQPEAPDQTGHAKPEVTTLGESIDGHTTYRLEANLASTSRDIYAIYGDKETLMVLPPAFQVAAPFGADIGGVRAEIIALNREAAYDSWLSVGLTDGASVRDGVIASTGIDFGGWTKDAGLSAGDGAVFWMDPTSAPTARRLVLAQLTIPSGTDWAATIAAQGHTAGGPIAHGSWDQALVFEHTCPDTAPAAAAETLGLGEGAATPCSALQLAVLRRCADDCATCDATKVGVVLGGCALPAGTSAAEVPCAGIVATVAPAVPAAASMAVSGDGDGDGVHELADLEAAQYLVEAWYASVLEDGPDKSGPTSAGAATAITTGAPWESAAAEAEVSALEEAVLRQHGGMLKWILSFVAAH